MSVYACIAKHALQDMPLDGRGATPMEILCYTEGIRGTGAFDRLVSNVSSEVQAHRKGPKAQTALDKFRKTATFKGTHEYSKRANQIGDQMKKSRIFKRSQAINNKCKNSNHKTWIYAIDTTLCNSGTHDRPTEPPTMVGPLQVGALSKSRPTAPTTNGEALSTSDDMELTWSDVIPSQPSTPPIDPKSAGGRGRRDRWPYLQETEETEYEKERAANIKQNQDKLHELLPSSPHQTRVSTCSPVVDDINDLLKTIINDGDPYEYIMDLAAE